jgi:hypothetical protein
VKKNIMVSHRFYDLERSPDFKGTYTFDALKSSNNAVSPVGSEDIKSH